MVPSRPDRLLAVGCVVLAGLVASAVLTLPSQAPALADDEFERTLDTVTLGGVDNLRTIREFGDTDDPPVSGRIVGGDDIDISQAPYQVALTFFNVAGTEFQQFCGGSIYNATWIITAAHCVDNRPGIQPDNRFRVGAGITTLSGNFVSDFTVVSEVIVHPDWNPTTWQNDIALLRLASPLTLNSTSIVPIRIPASFPPTWPAAGTPSWITGWGTLSFGGPSPDHLQGANIEVITGPDQVECGNFDTTEPSPSGPFYDRLTMLCAGFIQGGVDACQGDSGGPLAISVSTIWQLAGITSWGSGCAQPDLPGVYTRVTTYLGWITGHAGTQPTSTATSSTTSTTTTTTTPPPPPPPSAYTALNPARLLDTRPGATTVDGRFAGIGARPAGSITQLQITGRGGVTSTATAVALNVTVTGPDGPGYVTVWPCSGNPPNASNLNYTAGQTIPNSVITKLNTNGQICLFTDTTTNLIVDIAGQFT